jgi:precorrin-3B C17-methyltransferase
MSGALIVVGIGPGGLEHMTPAARTAIETADVILGYRTYLELIADLAPGTPREGHGMRQEVEWANRALDLAVGGQRVALVSSGDAGVYGMAGLAYDVARERAVEVKIEIVPGMSALNAAAALLGAPLMTDFAVISLSDHLTPLDLILRRVEAAARADFVLCLYNPKGRRRIEPFVAACTILLAERGTDTPVGLVRAATREGQQVRVLTLADLPAAEVDMLTLVVVGSSQTYLHEGWMITPRGYQCKYKLTGKEDSHD